MRPALLIAVLTAHLLFTPVDVAGEPPAARRSPLHGLCYGPFREGQSPDRGIHPTRQEIAEDLLRIRRLTTRLRTYGATRSGRVVVEEASRLGFEEIHTGLWLTGDRTANEREIGAAIELASRKLPGVTLLIAGSEVLLRREMKPTELVDVIRRVRNEARMPIAYADVPAVWVYGPPAIDALAREVDVVVVHLYPFWEGVSIDAAPAAYARTLDAARRRYPGKSIVVGESGWPAAGEPVGHAVPSPESQARWLAFAAGRPDAERVFYFSAFSEPWKAVHEGTRGAHWGLFTSDGHLRRGLWPTLTSLGVELAGLDFDRSASTQD